MGSKHDREMNTFYVTGACAHALHERMGSKHDGEMNTFYVTGACAHALHDERMGYVTGVRTHALYQRKGRGPRHDQKIYLRQCRPSTQLVVLPD